MCVAYLYEPLSLIEVIQELLLLLRSQCVLFNGSGM